MNVLLIEDSADLAANVGEFLESRGLTVDYAYDGRSGLHLAASNRYDVLILDLNLPGIDGLTLCRRLREGSHRDLPILMLTARDTEHDKLTGFEAGTDDYLTKPFSLQELLARLRALARRASGSSQEVTLEVGDLSFDAKALEVRRGTRRIELTPIELRLLELLMRASPGVVSRGQIERAVWGDAPPDSDAALRGHIHALRAAIDHGMQHKLLHTVHGIGYRIAVQNEL
ncbi:MAG: response regulator transcription factor [Gammaproteobacteria bacterium]|nr:response regulator transcription factor [Gammaproteobacteria bacterium]MDE2252024.1 response regulator transcription factor [Gammaproteobacteria bacterium]